jgi:predicted permease
LITVEGHRLKANEVPDAYANSISPGYLATLGVPILAGRDFAANDTATVLHEPPNGKVAAAILVNEKFAKGYFGSAANAIGRHVGLGIDPNTKTDMEIIGVFKDIKYTSLRDQVPAEICVPYMTEPHVGSMTVYVRTTLAAEQLFAAVRAKVRGLDPNLPMYSMTTLEEQVSNSLLVERLIASLSAVFGFLATLLAVIGLYGVMAYTVARRTREIGIRMALGAFQKHVIWMVMREVLVLVAAGIAVGLGATFALTRLVQSQLYGITPSDPKTLGLATLALTAVACAAGYIPALRASRVDAMEALRYE